MFTYSLFYYFKYILIKNETSIKYIAQYFLDTALEIGYHPDMALSIIGETKYQNIDDDVINRFKENIIKSRALDTWIITSGLDEGVDELVGEAIDEDLNTNFLPVFGITPLEELSLKEEIINKPPDTDTVGAAFEIYKFIN